MYINFQTCILRAVCAIKDHAHTPHTHLYMHINCHTLHQDHAHTQHTSIHAHKLSYTHLYIHNKNSCVYLTCSVHYHKITHTHIHICTRTSIVIHTSIHTCKFSYMYLTCSVHYHKTCVHAYIHTQTQTDRHTHTHAHTSRFGRTNHFFRWGGIDKMCVQRDVGLWFKCVFRTRMHIRYVYIYTHIIVCAQQSVVIKCVNPTLLYTYTRYNTVCAKQLRKTKLWQRLCETHYVWSRKRISF